MPVEKVSNINNLKWIKKITVRERVHNGRKEM